MTDVVARETGGRVQAGPFAGLWYPTSASAGSVLAPKLIGSYEREIHRFVEQALARGPRRVINVGAGEGYYAVGIALRLPNAEVHAFETVEAAQALCASLARANGVSSRVHVHGACEVEDLRRLTAEPSLVICDVEGAEVELLDPTAVPGLSACEVIAERHRLRGGETSGIIRRRFGATHTAAMAHYHRRRDSSVPEFSNLSRSEWRVALDERRKHGLEWIHLVPALTS